MASPSWSTRASFDGPSSPTGRFGSRCSRRSGSTRPTGSRAATNRSADALERAHSAYFRDLAEEAEPFLTSERQATWLATLERELDNLRAVLDRADRDPDAQDIEDGLRIAGAIWRFWQQRGRLPEGRARLERMLARPEAQRRDAVRARALGAFGSIVYWQGDQERVLGSVSGSGRDRT